MKILYTVLLALLPSLLLASPPTVPSSNLYFAAIDGGYFNLGFTAGNGARRLIVCKANSAPGFLPQNGVDYDANSIFGLGPEVAPGEFIIYDHFSTSFFLTGLNPATQYYFRIFDYNGSGATTEYLTSSFLSGSGTTSATPTTQTSNAVFSAIATNSVTVSWTNGNGFRRLIVVRENSPVNADPVNGLPYNVSYIFGSGATTGAGNYTVYNSTGTYTSVTNLKPGTEYFFSFYEFNGSGQPQYLAPAYSASVTTRSIPTVASTALSITKTDGKELSLAWTNGNGQRRIIVAKKSSDILSSPVNGTDYAANPVFGSGAQIGAGEFVVYDDNFNAATVSGLDPATTYYFKIFEYDGTGTNTVYLTSLFGSINAATASTPTVQAQAEEPANITSGSLRLQFVPGNGRARLVIGRKNAAVNFNPVDFTNYNTNSAFGNGTDLGNGNFALAITTGSSVNVQNLQPSSTYHFAIYELNGFDQPLYLLPGATINATTLGTLPVDLVSWDAIPANGKVKLQWKTSSELNASHFVIERSGDGTNFSPMTTVNAAGNSQSDVTYLEEDANPLPGRSYYRLKMVDLDGTFEYSAVRTVLFETKSFAKIIGNPVRDVLQVTTSKTSNNTNDKWEIINASGQILMKGALVPGKTEIRVSALPTGSYWLRINIEKEVNTMSFIRR